MQALGLLEEQLQADYSYLWTDGSGALVGTTSSVTGLSAGTYTVVVTDDNGCTETVDVTINNQPCRNGYSYAG